MKVYLAGSWSDQPRITGYAAALRRRGWTIASTWHQPGKPDTARLPEPEVARDMAAIDLAGIDATDLVVVFTDVPSTTGGLHVEMGYALGRDKPLILVGPIVNVFGYLPACHRRYVKVADLLLKLDTDADIAAIAGAGVADTRSRLRLPEPRL